MASTQTTQPQNSPAAGTNGSNAVPVMAGDASHLVAHLSGELKGSRPSAAYLGIMAFALSLAVTAFLIYVGIAGAGAWGLYLWATSIIEQIQTSRTRIGGLWALLQIVGFVMAVPVWVALVKPIFLPSTPEPEAVELTEYTQPMLHGYLAALAKKMGAPKPTRIFTDASVNAYAAPRPVLFGLLGMRYDLCVGLPLFHGMSAREVTGVIAHELGHFSQGTGMRVGMLSRAIGYWFWKIVFVRDIWDYQLWKWTQTEDGPIRVMALITLTLSELVRVIPLALLYLVTLGDSLLSRQMEHDADRHEVRVAGSEASARVSTRLLELQLAAATAAGRVSQWLAKGKVPSDLVKIHVRSARQLAPEQLTKRVKLGVGAKADVFASHPTGKERIDRAMAMNEPGICTLEGPGTVLLMNPDQLGEEVTRAVVQQAIGPRGARRVQFVPVDDYLAAHEATDRALDTLRSILSPEVAHTLTIEPIFLTSDQVAPADEPAPVAQRMAQAKAALKAARPAAQAGAKQMRAADLMLEQATQARMLLKLRAKIKAADFGMDRASLPEAEERIDRARTEISGASGDVEEFTKALRTYIYCALQLASTKKLDGVIAGRAALATEIKKLVELNSALRKAWPHTSQLQSTRTSLEALASQLTGREPTDIVTRQFDALLKPTGELINQIDAETNHLADPFLSTPTEYRSLWHTLVPIGVSDHPPEEDFGVVLGDWLNVVSVLLDEHHAIARRMLLRFIEIAATVEKSLARHSAQGN